MNRSQGVSSRLRISDELDYGDAPAWETELRAGGVDGKNRVSGKRGTSGGGSHRFRFAAAEPGMYALCVPELPGFELVEPIEIEIPAGEFVTHEVWLAKRP